MIPWEGKRRDEKTYVYANPGKVEVGNSKVTNSAVFGEQLFLSVSYTFLRTLALLLISIVFSCDFLLTSFHILHHG